MKELVDEFRSEAGAINETLQGLLMSLEGSNQKDEVVEELFRGLHTLKGSARMFGYSNIERVTHQLEDIFDEIREGNRTIDRPLIGLTMEATDFVALALQDAAQAGAEEGLAQRISQYLTEGGSANAEAMQGYLILYRPAPTVFERGINPLALFDELYALGEAQTYNHHVEVPLETQVDTKTFTAAFDIWLRTAEDMEEVEDVFLFNKPEEFRVIALAGQPEDALWEPLETMLDVQLSEEEKAARRAHLEAAQPAVQEAPVVEEAPTAAPELPSRSGHSTSKVNYINVPLGKLDTMMNLVSELVSVKAELEYRAEVLGDTELLNCVEELEKLSTRFRDNAFTMRLVPIQLLTVKLQRVVHDLSHHLGKEVNFITEGMDTEIDKAIINEIEAPLMHIMRNALDHGLESPEERLAAGKPAEGILKLSAFHSGADAFIHIQDDGRGLDLKKIRQKAVQKGLIEAKAKLSEQEIIDLIFLPGFSTQSETTETSGRGVGLDVVHKNIQELRGSIEVTTEPGLGTSFAIRLPLSLSIMDVMQVRVGHHAYLLPHSEIVECTSERLEGANISRKGHNLNYQGQLCPLIDLNEQFNGQPTSGEDKAMVVLSKNDQLIAVEVEEIIGVQQVVIKPVDPALQRIKYLSGTSVLGNGDLAFMIDVVRLREYLDHALA